ncbi:MAG: TonB-dependent receptor [Bacteroidales bacterium]|nr:TonB-dependent receptor [Bacteroidales bacterium]
MTNRFLIGFLIFILATKAFGQQPEGTLYGQVTNESGEELELVNVAVIGMTGGTVTDSEGKYELKVPANALIKVAFSYIGYNREIFTVRISANQKRKLDVNLSIKFIETTTIEGKRTDNQGMKTLPARMTKEIPTVSGNAVEELVKRTGLGVSSNNELSSQYSVRGGNYDENLVYVNGIQIYRPFLVSTGEQEGLSFLNPDLVENIKFSAGGFAAKYGDKMSSVLDITYKEPERFDAGFQASLLGASAFAQDVNSKKTLSYIAGIRYKTNQYLLNSLETSGEYQPTFLDFQGLVLWKPSPVFHVSLLGNISENIYEMIPESRETRFGTLNEALRFKVYFDGREVDRFRTYNSALTLRFEPSDEFNIRLIAAAYRSDESETYDIQGQYWLDELETDLGADDFASAGINRGVGTYLEHARNYLKADVFSVKHMGSFLNEKWNLHWGLKAQREIINDEMWEYTMLDSAGYSLPHSPDNIGNMFPFTPDNTLEMNKLIVSESSISSTRYSGYLQNKWDLSNEQTEYYLTTGMRFQYWTLNDEWLISPRLSIDIDPTWENDITYRLAGGVYYQPPFFREMRGFDGRLNTDIQAQRSIHAVAGQYWDFLAWGRPFHFATEIYYKHLDNLIPYEVDNVRLRYFADNMAHGYATGVDMKINGEFVNGVESYAGLSVMQTQADIEGDYYFEYYNSDGELIVPGFSVNDTPVDSVKKEPGYVPRPTDRRVNFTLYFQDYLPKNPTYKMHLNLVFGTGLPFGPPSHERYKDTLRMPSYKRVDIGFSKQLIAEDQGFRANSPFRHFESIWVTLEVFNLLQNNNTVSYLWISDINNRQYAIPKYLTSRRINFRLIAKF